MTEKERKMQDFLLFHLSPNKGLIHLLILWLMPNYFHLSPNKGLIPTVVMRRRVTDPLSSVPNIISHNPIDKKPFRVYTMRGKVGFLCSAE